MVKGGALTAAPAKGVSAIAALTQGARVSGFRQQVRQWKWAVAEPLHSVLCLPGGAVPLIAAVLLGYPGTGVLMAGGAQTAGSASFQQGTFRRWSPMLIATLGIALSAAVGALCRNSTPLLLSVVLLWSVIYGLANSVSTGASWVSLQCCVFLIVSSAAPSSPGSPQIVWKAALLRGAGVLAGGLVQTGTVLLLQRWLPSRMPTGSA